jgi:hypothetical protein
LKPGSRRKKEAMATQISQFRNRVLVEVPGCPIPRIDLAIVNSIRKMCKDSYAHTKSFEDEDIDYTTIDATDNDSITINLATYFTGVDPVAPLKFQIDGGDWDLRELILENDNSNLDQIAIQGVKFFNFPSLTTMKLFPFTDQGANFDVFLKLAVKPTRGETSVEDKFYNDDDWFEGIIHCAAYRLQAMPNRPWSNGNNVSYNRSMYNHYMGRVKIDLAHGGTAGSLAVEGGYF